MTLQTTDNPRTSDEMAPLPGGDHAGLRARLQRVLHDASISQSALAREVGYSSTSISQFMNGNYKGDNDAVAAALGAWVDKHQGRVKATSRQICRPDFVRTATAREFMQTLSMAQLLAEFVVLCGAPGIGKTLSAKQYVGANRNVWLVTMQPVTTTPQHLMSEIEQSFNISRRPGRSQMRRIGEFVSEKQGLLIIDEAQHLTTAALDQLRSIQDQYACGIAVLGNEGLNLRLAGDGTQAEFAQLTSRIGLRLHRPNARPDDIEQMIESWGITNGAMRDFLTRISRKKGHLRVLDKVMQLACQVADGEGSALSVDHLKQAYAWQSSQAMEF